MNRKKLSVILPLQKKSIGFPVALIDWDRVLNEKNIDYELIVVGKNKDIRIQTLKNNLRFVISNIIFSFSESDNLEDLIESGVDSSKGDVVILASPEVFITNKDFDNLFNTIGSGADVVFGRSETSNSLTEAIGKTLSPIGLFSFERGVISISKHYISNLIPLIKMFPKDIPGALAIALKKNGSNISESMLEASSMPNLPEKSPSRRMLTAFYTKITFEISWIRSGNSILRRIQ